MAQLENAAALLAPEAEAPIRPIWEMIREEAEDLARREPLMRETLQDQVLSTECNADIVVRILAARLAVARIPFEDLNDLFHEVLGSDEQAMKTVEADLRAVQARDPACRTYLHALLNLKGFQSLQAHRIAHRLWHEGREDIASWLANLTSVVFGLDIHPAAKMGCGIMLDHGTGIVIGETAVVEDCVSILQNVTLGGTGKECGDRHPKIGRGVMLGAGAKILGNIRIGEFVKVAAGSVVLQDVPPRTTVAGVPAKVVRIHRADENPAESMDQCI